MTPEVVASGIGFGEGPVWRSEQGDLVVTSVSALDTLFLTDAGNGTVLAFAGMPTPGHPLRSFVLRQVDR